MAEPLKNQFGENVLNLIGAELAAVSSQFNVEHFDAVVRQGFEDLELMPRAWQIADVMAQSLPQDFESACQIMLESLGNPLEVHGYGPCPFKYLPHTFFVARYGLEHFEMSMKAQYELTQRFTAEYSIRPFIERYPEATLDRLRSWTTDESPHVRRLVSEGTRPRLPWAPHLKEFQKDPTPVLELLEILKDDPARYVTRSVANNLNDIGKDHPAILTKVAKRWLKDASDERMWVIKHALRSAIKRGEPGALEVLGFGADVKCEVSNVSITPNIELGDHLTIAFDLQNLAATTADVLVDLRIHFVKADQSSSPKVFKLRTWRLAPGERIHVSKRIRIAPLTTRKHYPGEHLVDVVINGTNHPIGAFILGPC